MNSTDTATLTSAPGSATLTFGGGCFWCTEAVFKRTKGVLRVVPGYSNGQTINPSYEQVCRGDTGHNEVVRVTFDPSQIVLGDLLSIFFVIHDPTTLNRQGNDVGTQYRSGIYASDPQQLAVVEGWLKAALADGDLPAEMVTEVALEANFWPAEAYHHDYFTKNPNQGYCAFVVAPKVAKFKQVFARFLND
jgi:peptide-methionine (S)-S-oxide reductase